MEGILSDNDLDTAWHDSVERLLRGLEPEIDRSTVRKAFAVLRSKWQTGDDTVNAENMSLYLGVSEADCKRIIEYYESQHLCTKYKLI